MADRLVLDPDQLSSKDMKRARAMLAKRDDLDIEKDPWKLLEDLDNSLVLTIWCFKVRTDPDFTWEQAEETPFGEFDAPPDKGPPPNALPSSPGSKPKGSAKTNLSSMPSGSESAPSSASSTASRGKNSTS